MAKKVEVVDVEIVIPDNHEWIKFDGIKFGILGWDIDKGLYLIDKDEKLGVVGFAYLKNDEENNVVWKMVDGREIRQNRQRIQRGNLTTWKSLLPPLEDGLQYNLNPRSSLVYKIEDSRHVYGLFPQEKTFYLGRASTFAAILLPAYFVVLFFGLQIFGLMYNKSWLYRHLMLIVYILLAVIIHLLLPSWVYAIGIFISLCLHWTSFIIHILKKARLF